MNLGKIVHRGQLICITGIDGAGKTTVSKAVRSELRARGDSVHYTWAMHHPILLFPVLMLARILVVGEDDHKYTDRTAKKTDATHSHPLLSKLYIGLLLVDYSLQLIVKVWLPLLIGRTVICDRYIFDTVIIQLSVDFQLSPEQAAELTEKLLWLHPYPDAAFYIRVPPEVSMERKDDIPDRKYLTQRKQYYEALLDEFGIVALDGTDPVEKSVSEIVDSI
jgi:dTMP kinase